MPDLPLSRCVCSLVMLCLLMLQPPQPSVAQSGDQMGGSLFTDDPCAPPCFFDVTPGVSTAEDAQAAVSRWIQADVFIEPDIADGESIIFFDWRHYNHPEKTYYAGNRFEIRDGIVEEIWLDINRVVTLKELLRHYGRPTVSYATSLFGFVFDITLLFSGPNIIVSVGIPNSQLDQCVLSELEDYMEVYNIIYYAPELADDLFELEGVFLPPETLEAWLGSTSNALCRAKIDDWVWQDQVVSGKSPYATFTADEPCRPPCWFGLQIGATEREVADMLTTYPGVFYVESPETLVDWAQLQFTWQQSTRQLYGKRGINYIGLANGLVSDMRIAPNWNVTLADTLAYLGQPETFMVVNQRAQGQQLRFTIPAIVIIYPTKQVAVSFEIVDRNEDRCLLESMESHAFVRQIRYLGATAYQSLYDDLAGSSQYHVMNPAQWNAWLDANPTESCRSALNRLSSNG